MNLRIGHEKSRLNDVILILWPSMIFEGCQNPRGLHSKFGGVKIIPSFAKKHKHVGLSTKRLKSDRIFYRAVSSLHPCVSLCPGKANSIAREEIILDE